MRILLSIGCDRYERLSPLFGAENDAQSLYDHLVTDEWGEYDRQHSRLLLSPSLAEVREAIDRVLFSSGSVAEFSFFFAGHGAVKDGAYFLCPKDCQADRLSLTALSMTQLFSWIGASGVMLWRAA